MNKKIPIVWIIIGLLEVYFVVSGYIRYSSEGLYSFMFPEQIEIKSILFGIISIWIGLGLLVTPKQQIKLIYSLPIWMIFYILINYNFNASLLMMNLKLEEN